MLVAAVVLLVLLCTAGLVWFVSMGAYRPAAHVCAGSEIPDSFLEIIKDVGALEEGEKVLYFYSDAMTDVRDRFYYVSDRKVVRYLKEGQPAPLTVVHFDEIVELKLEREESDPHGGRIILLVRGGRPVSFPVSREADGDQRFFDAIKTRAD